jgi:hypothetical protein
MSSWVPYPYSALKLTTIRRLFNRRMRTERMHLLWERFGLTTDTRVLDVGGTGYNWSLLPERPRVVVLNLWVPDASSREGLTWLVGDGLRLPFRDEEFDVVFSNSVIEHLSTAENQRVFAEECRRVGRRYYVQTPNRYFPIDPHFATPFFHWLPSGLQRRLLRRFTLWGVMTKPSLELQDHKLRTIRLLDPSVMRRLFPEAEIWRERLLGLTKSVVAATPEPARESRRPAVPASRP